MRGVGQCPTRPAARQHACTYNCGGRSMRGRVTHMPSPPDRWRPAYPCSFLQTDIHAAVGMQGGGGNGPTTCRHKQAAGTHMRGLFDKRTHLQQPIYRSAAGRVHRAAITHAGARELLCRARQRAFAPRTRREALHTTARPPARAMPISAAGGPPSRSRTLAELYPAEMANGT